MRPHLSLALGASFAAALVSAAVLASLGTALPGCQVGTSINEYPCPPGGTMLTYDNFGEVFFDEWCVRCHGGPHSYSSRSFTTLADIQANKDRIFINAAASNAFMPPGPDGPPESQRQELAVWLACGAP
jgi:hypothetical protein